MAREKKVFQYGAAVYPLKTSTANSLLQDVDPALYYVTDYFTFCLTEYLGDRFMAEVAATGSDITAAVAYTVPDDPSDYLTAEQVKFPLLAVYRVRESYTDRTQGWRADVSEWKVAYVLPPLTPSQREQLHPILRGVGRVLDNRCETSFDPDYLGGASPFGPTYANLESIQLTGAEYVSWEAGGDLVFPAVMLTLQIKERQMQPANEYDPLDGTDTVLPTVDGVVVATFPTPTT